MKIEILATPGDLSPFVLFPGGLDSPEELEGSASDQLQLIELARSAEVTPFNRGNRRHEHRLQRTIDYGSVAAAENAIWSHPRAVPTGSYVRITSENGPPYVRLLTNATVHAFSYRQIGTSIVWKYTITHGLDVDQTNTYLAPVAGVTPLYGIVRIITTGFAYWMQILDNVAGSWWTIWWVNGVFSTSTAAMPALIGCRINGGFLQLLDSVTGGFRDIWWAASVLQCGPVDNTAADGAPPTAFRLRLSAGSYLIELSDSANPGQFRALLLSSTGAAIAGPLVS